MCNSSFQNLPIQAPPPPPPSQTTHDPDRSVHTTASYEMQNNHYQTEDTDLCIVTDDTPLVHHFQTETTADKTRYNLQKLTSTIQKLTPTPQKYLL
jgi:hypothetical protein